MVSMALTSTGSPFRETRLLDTMQTSKPPGKGSALGDDRLAADVVVGKESMLDSTEGYRIDQDEAMKQAR